MHVRFSHFEFVQSCIVQLKHSLFLSIVCVYSTLLSSHLLNICLCMGAAPIPELQGKSVPVTILCDIPVYIGIEKPTEKLTLSSSRLFTSQFITHFKDDYATLTPEHLLSLSLSMKRERATRKARRNSKLSPTFRVLKRPHHNARRPTFSRPRGPLIPSTLDQI